MKYIIHAEALELNHFCLCSCVFMYMDVCYLCVSVFMKQRQRLINTRTLTNGDSDVPVKGGSRRGIENGLSGAERGVNVHQDDREAGNETENEDNENNENDEEEEEEDGEGPFVPFQCPGTWRLSLHSFNNTE